jgi:flagellin FlaB
MLGAGFFTTQKSQEVVHTGVTQASSSIAPAGDVIAHSTTNGQANEIIFYITNTAGGTAVDLNKTIITYTDSNDFVSKSYSGTNGWEYQPIVYEAGHNDNLLESGEKYKVALQMTTMGATDAPGINEQIKIEVKPPEGAVLSITKIMPPALVSGQFYPVF